MFDSKSWKLERKFRRNITFYWNSIFLLDVLFKASLRRQQLYLSGCLVYSQDCIILYLKGHGFLENMVKWKEHGVWSQIELDWKPHSDTSQVFSISQITISLSPLSENLRKRTHTLVVLWTLNKIMYVSCLEYCEWLIVSFPQVMLPFMENFQKDRKEGILIDHWNVLYKIVGHNEYMQKCI